MEDNLKRWCEHFHSVLNRPEPENAALIPEPTQDININIELPSIQEIKEAIREMRNGKAPGADGIYAELLKVEESLTFFRRFSKKSGFLRICLKIGS